MVERKLVGEIKDYTFSTIGSQAPAAAEFKFTNLQLTQKIDVNVLAQEHGHATNNGFVISEDVRQQRGLAEYELNQQKARVENLVNEKFTNVREQGYSEGYQQGLDVAKSEIEKKYSDMYEKSLQDLQAFISLIKDQQYKAVELNRKDVMKILEVVTKWVLHREVDVKYVERLILSMLTKIQGEQFLVLKVDSKTFADHQQIQELVHQKFPNFKNIRMEHDELLKHPTVIVETESGLLDGSWDTQMQSVEKLFSEIKE